MFEFDFLFLLLFIANCSLLVPAVLIVSHTLIGKHKCWQIVALAFHDLTENVLFSLESFDEFVLLA